MQSSRFATEQIIGILKKAESGRLVKKLCRKNDMNDVALCHWKAK